MKKEVFMNEIKRVSEDISKHYRAQRKVQTRYQSRILAFNITRIVFAALTALGVVLILFFPLKWLTVLTILTAMVVLTMSIFDRNTVYKDMIFNIQENLQSLWSLQEECRRLLFDLSYSDDSDERVWTEWEQLIENRKALYDQLLVLSPQIEKSIFGEGVSVYPTVVPDNQESETAAFTITDELAK